LGKVVEENETYFIPNTSMKRKYSYNNSECRIVEFIFISANEFLLTAISSWETNHGPIDSRVQNSLIPFLRDIQQSETWVLLDTYRNHKFFVQDSPSGLPLLDGEGEE
jgi:hypothetical protein